MLQDIAREFTELERYDFRVLQAVETGMRFLTGFLSMICLITLGCRETR